MTIRVRVESPNAATADHDLGGPDAVIGRATTAALVIPDSRVSRQHARLVERDGHWWVEDLGARNRTLLNGAPLMEPARLWLGDCVGIGDSIVRVVAGAAAREGSSAAAPTRGSARSPLTETGGVDRLRDAARMSTLHEIHRALAGPLSLTALLDLILERCFDVVGPEEGTIMLRGAGGVLTSVASRRLGTRGDVSVPRRLVDEVVGKVQPALVIDAAYDERFSGSASMVSSGIRSIVAAPLVDAEGTLGLIVLCSRLGVRQFTQGDLDLLVSIASAAALRVRNVALAEELAARRVIEHELALAHEVQMSMLPRDIPERPELAIGARLQPAQSVGGDLYDFVLDGDRVWFIVADVAGKSIAAALYMAIVRTLFRATAADRADVVDVAVRMNRELARENERTIFVTAAIGCLDLRSGELALVDAGHNPALLVGPEGEVGSLAVPKCMALGVMEDFPYTASRVTLDAGATLLLYTDGITDARNRAGEMFGEKRLERAIVDAATRAPADLVASVSGVVDAFASGAPVEDDLTLLAVQYRGG